MEIKKLNGTIISFDESKQGVNIVEFKKGQNELESQFYALETSESYLPNYDFLDKCFIKLTDILRGKQLNNSQVSVIIPTRYVTIDFISVPNLNKNQIVEALKTELVNTYKNAQELEIRTEVFDSNRNFITFLVSIINRHILEKIHKKMSELHLFPKNVLSQSTAIANAAMALRPKLKHSTCLVMNISSDTSTITLMKNGQSLGGMQLDFGDEILIDNAIIPEYALHNHNLANKIVYGLGALQENAKFAFTQQDLQEHMFCDTEKCDSQLTADTPCTENSESDLPKIMETKMQFDKYVASKFLKKQLPDTPQEILKENLNVFIKQLENFYLFASSKPELPTFDVAYINTKKDIKQILNSAETDTLQISLLNENNEGLEAIINNFESFGAMTIYKLNKNQIF